jgi:xylan 1,4-beta-xylosidase
VTRPARAVREAEALPYRKALMSSTTSVADTVARGDEAAPAPVTPPLRNPVLPGFHPDPSILRVGEDYYLATSTFEWYPGVRLHHSRDLVHWRTLGGALTETRLLDLAGTPDSGGVWAPCLTYAHGRFHLVFTNVAAHGHGWWDTPNHITTAESIEGPWSDPVAAHSRGFDPSLFHDEDGRCWLLSMTADWHPDREPFAGIQIQEYDCGSGRLLGAPRIIFTGTEAGITEGPHLYRIDGWYYLLTAEGGTGYEHQVTMARSRELFGPYTPDPDGAALTAVDRPDLPLQKAGHGSLVQTPAGQWYLAHLTARPYTPLGRCVLGRETAIQAVEWNAEGWPRVPGGIPHEVVPAPDLPPHPFAPEPAVDDFDGAELGPQWSTLRRAASREWIDLETRPSFLRISGGQSPHGGHTPSLVARRVTSPTCTLETVVEADPAGFQQLAGITAYYNSANYHFLCLTRSPQGRRELNLLTGDSGRRIAYPEAVIPVEAERVGLRVTLDGERAMFAYDAGEGWQTIPVELDATILSDEYASHQGVTAGRDHPGFTGAFVGLWVMDFGNDGGFADFDFASYTVH